MNKYSIRFNKTRGQIGRGSEEHVWRIFENGKEYLFKSFRINVPSYSELDEQTGTDWNVSCEGYMTIDHENSIAIINSSIQEQL